MKLEELLGAELYQQVQAKIDAQNEGETDKLKHVRYADLSEGGYVSRSKYDSLSAEKDNLAEQIKTLNGTIAELEKNNSDNEALQTSIKALQDQLKEQQTQYDSKVKEFALKESLTKAGVLDPDYLIYKAGGADKFNFDKEGKPIGVEESIKSYKEDTTMAHLFKAESKPGTPHAGTHGGGNNAVSNPFAKDTFNLTEQGKLMKENPEQARSLAAAAGITI